MVDIFNEKLCTKYFVHFCVFKLPNKIVDDIRMYQKYIDIERLKVGDLFLIDKFPKLKWVNFSDNFNQPINDALPSRLTHLTFGDNFDQPINGALPKHLTHLIFGAYLTHLIFDFFLCK